MSGLAGGAGAVYRMLMDQLLFAPFFLSTFLASLLTLEVLRTPAAPSWGARELLTLVPSSSAATRACYLITCPVPISLPSASRRPYAAVNGRSILL